MTRRIHQVARVILETFLLAGARPAWSSFALGAALALLCGTTRLRAENAGHVAPAAPLTPLPGDRSDYLPPPVFFSAPERYDDLENPTLLMAGDVDGDGRTELFVSLMDGQIILMRCQTNGRPGKRSLATIPSTGAFPGDFNQDGSTDIMFRRSSGVIDLSLADENGGFGPPAPVDSDNDTPYLVAGDWNGDGLSDLGITRYHGALVTALGHGDGTFGPRATNSITGLARRAAVADFNEDGFDDVVVELGDPWGLGIMLSSGDSGFGFERIWTQRSPCGLPGVGDLNGDGHTDFAIVDELANEVVVLLGDGRGRFCVGGRSSVGSSPRNLALGDFNYDGISDLAVACADTAALSVLSGRGDGTFAPARQFPGAWNVEEVVTGDFDGDGRLDVATRNVTDSSVSVLSNTATDSGATAGFSLPETPPEPPRGKARPGPVKTTGYYIDQWTTHDGLPQNAVLSLLQTREGYLWIGTQGGLARFDGLKFTVYDRGNAPAFRSDVCLALAEAVDGVYIGTPLGLIKRVRDTGELQMVRGSEKVRVNAVCAARDGRVWAATQSGPAWVENGALVLCPNFMRQRLHYSIGFQLEPHSLLEDSAGTLWLGNGRGLHRRNPADGTWKLEYGIPGVFGLMELQGQLWVAGQFGLHRVADGVIQNWVDQNDVGFGWVVQAAVDRWGDLWLAGPGVTRLRGREALRFTTGDGLLSDAVKAICADTSGGVWVGTPRGLNRLRRKTFNAITTAEGLVDDDVWSISQAPDGSVWIGTSGGVSQITDEHIASFDVPGRPNIGTQVLAARSGKIYSNAAALVMWEDGLFKPILHPGTTNTPIERVNSMWEDMDGSLWLGIEDLGHLRAGPDLKVYGPGNGLSAASVNSMLRDAAGRLWIGTFTGGINIFDQGKFTHLGPKDGLSSVVAGPVLADPDGTVWIGSDRGLNRWKAGQITRYTEADGLLESVVLNALEDNYGWFWLNGHRGIYRIRKQELIDFAEGTANRLHPIAYGLSDGLLSVEGNGGRIPNSCKTRDGRLWFPTTRGVAVADPKDVRTAEAPPSVLVEEVLVDGSPANPLQSSSKEGTSLVLAPGRARDVRIRFTAPVFNDARRVRFQYRLDGQDKNWRDNGTERLAIYTNLRPGQYAFRVRAAAQGSDWVEGAAPFMFSLAPYAWQTRWFWTLAAAGVVAGAAGVQAWRLQIQRRILRLEQQHQLELERARIAHDIHDDVGGSLTRIQLLGQVVMDESRSQPGGEVRFYAREIAATAQQLAQRMDEIVWAVNPQQDSLSGFIDYICHSAQEMAHLAGLRCHLDVPPGIQDQPLAAELRHNLYLLAKEALHNVIKHARATHLTIAIATQHGHLTIRIADDGKGFDPAQKPVAAAGLAGMAERVQRLNGRLQIQSQLGGPTVIAATVPLS